ncbi:verrucotoxin subunit beta-like [Hemiscyllium ocellatum]|uniref:verrucotoxin subunit beta-like n=1 Tax=Hemiscyllium ocellatum TaxID=170820 RepID=UPI002965E43B|nr:verrucotoxin subunit beta-like [Hemiscyllium ocellatum]
MAEGDNDIFEMPTLGRPLRTGMLYDRRSDTFIPGVTLWDLDDLLKNLDVRPKPNTNFSIICSDSIEEKASHLNVEASLKASFLGGLVEVGGSARYLQDSKSSKQQARVTLNYQQHICTLNYQATTRFEQLTMRQLGPKNIAYPSVFEQGSATHVVTAVLYGAQAFFVFDQEYSCNDNKHEVEGNLQVMIKKIPFLSIEGKGSLQLSDDENKIVKKFNCTFHGDFMLIRNPVSYQDALNVYSTLPELLGDDGRNVVPLRVWLYPLKMLDSKAAQIVREVSVGLVNWCQLLFDQFLDIEMRCNDLIKSVAAREFSKIKVKILMFKGMCLEYQTIFKKDLGKVLTSIRGTGEEESRLANILQQREQSPFSNKSLTAWMEKREKEINTVGGYLTMFQGVDVLTSSQLDKYLTDPMVEHVVCFTFTSLWYEDIYFQELSNYLKTSWSLTVSGHTSQTNTSQPSEDWFSLGSISQQMRKQAKLFLQFIQSNASFMKSTNLRSCCKIAIASVDDKNITGASIFLYEQGILINKEFKPQKLDTPEIIGTSDNSVTLKLKVPEDNTGLGLMFLVEFRCIQDEVWSWKCTQDSSETFTVTGLQPHCQYQFRAAHIHKSFIGLFSDPTVSVLTTTSHGLSASKAPPVRVGDGANIEYQKGGDQWGPQSSVLGRQLFTIYINDIDKGIERNISEFADGTNLDARVKCKVDVTRIQGDLDRLEWPPAPWCCGQPAIVPTALFLIFTSSKSPIPVGYGQELRLLFLDPAACLTCSHTRLSIVTDWI